MTNVEPRICAECGLPFPEGADSCPQCSTAILKRDFPSISGYRIIELLAEGGMGAIYLAEDLSLERRVAIKVISKRIAGDAESRTRFAREARSLATVEHPNVVHVYAYGEVDGQAYLVMEFVEGETLSELIRREEQLPIDQALRIIRQTVEALDAAWEKKIVHRDIKPSNILIDRRGHVRVADFGLAKPLLLATEHSLTHSGYLLGTPHYISPEQAQGKPVDFRSDIYSLGMMLYEMLTGERAFQGTTTVAIVAKHLNDPLPSLRQKRRDASAEIERLLQWMTQKDPELRPKSYGEIREAIDAILGVTPTKRRALGVLKASNASRWLYGVAAVLALVAIGRSVAPAIRGASTVRDAADTRLVVAVTPFYGPDADSVKEGRVMAALVEKSIAARLGSAVRVVGIDQTKEPVRDHEQARKLGERFRAAVVVWGEAFALKNETEVQPFFTLIQKKKEVAEKKSDEDLREAVKGEEDPVAKLTERAAGVTRVGAEAPNQIELRKTSAEGVGEMVSFLAGLDALYNRDDPRGALKFFAQAPKSAEVLRHTSQAHLRDRSRKESAEDAIVLLEEAVALEPSDVPTRVQLGDLYLQTDRVADAVSQYREVSKSESAYSARNAIYHDGRLYVRETYRTQEGLLDSGYLIALDPITLNVVERHLLPGRVRTFSPSADGFTMEYEMTRDEGSPTETIEFSAGRFSAPVHLPVNMQLRMREMKSAGVLAENFMSDMSGPIEKQAPHPRFRPARKDVIEDAPNTFEQLEPALRAAIARDPTQPWHRFYLGQLLNATGRKPEAEKVFEELLTRDFSAIPYREYAWMAKYFERLGQPSWADRSFRKAVEKRGAMPQGIGPTTLIERLINVPTARLHPEQLKSPERAYEWLVRSRDLSGATEADHLASAAWARYFRDRGELQKAEREEEMFERLRRDPWNFTARATRLDYALYFFATMVLTTLLVIGLVMAKAVARHRASASRSREWGRIFPSEMSRAAKIILTIVIVTFIAFALKFLSESPGASESVTMALILAAVVAVLVARLRPSGVLHWIEHVSRSERLAVAACFALILIALSLLVVQEVRFSGLSGVSIGMADSLGHASIVRDLESRLKGSNHPDLRYVAAAAHAFSGNRRRANELYRSLGDESRAKAALRALQHGQVVTPSPEELESAYCHLTLRAIGKVFAERHGVTILAFVALILTALVTVGPLLKNAPIELAVPPAPRSRIGRIISKVLFTAVPGSFDVRRGSIWRGAIMLSMTIFVALLVIGGTKALRVFGAPGFLTAMALPNIERASPFPPPFTEGLKEHFWTLFWAHPYAEIFWPVSTAIAATLFVLHLMRLRAIWNFYRDEAFEESRTLLTKTVSA